VIFISKTV